MSPTGDTSLPRPRWVRVGGALLTVLTLVLGGAHGRVVAIAAGHGRDNVHVVLDELAFLRGALDDGAGERMQELFPEGYFFSYALYGLAWCELAVDGRAPPAEAASRARWASEHLHSAVGTAPFDRRLEPSYGVFYAGWTLLLDACATDVAPSPQPGAVARVAAAADGLAEALATALEGGPSPYLEAYPGQAWPVDTVVALAALATSGRVTGENYAELHRRWVAATASDLDPRTGLLPHRVDPATGTVLDQSRGSSQSVIQRFWPLVDPAGAPLAYGRFREHFLTRELGVVAVREYPHGVAGAGDVDSGPLLLGVSVSATAVAVGAARANGDRSLADVLTGEIDTFGLPVTWRGERRYAGGVLPVGDAFVAWARATAVADTGTAAPEFDPPTPWYPAWLAIPWALVLAGWLALLLAVARGLIPAVTRRVAVRPTRGG